MKPLRAIDILDACALAQVDDAVLIPRGPGHRLPTTVRALCERDQLLREAANRFCVGMSASGAATKLATELERFRCTAWRRDAAEPKCPPHYLGTAREFFWRVLQTRDAPIAARTIRRALGSNGD